MKKSYFVRLMSLGVASVVLVGALAAAAISGSPYDTLKSAFFNTLTIENATIQGQASLKVDGNEIINENYYREVGDNSQVEKTTFINGQEVVSYSNDTGLRLNQMYENLGGDVSKSKKIYDAYLSGYQKRDDGKVFGVRAEELDSATVRFTSILADLIIGDLKNNINMNEENGIKKISGTITSEQVPEIINAGIDLMVANTQNRFYSWSDTVYNSDNTSRTVTTYSIENNMKNTKVVEETLEPADALDQNAPPANDTASAPVVVRENRGFAAHAQGAKEFIHGNGAYSGEIAIVNGAAYKVTDSKVISETSVPATSADYPKTGDMLPMKSCKITYVHGEADIDENGNITRISGSARFDIVDMFDKVSEMEFTFSGTVTNIGTTVAACPIPGAAEALTADKLKAKFGDEFNFRNVTFGLNEDGSIDENSISLR